MSEQLSAKQRDALLHMTGLDRSAEAYRSHYAADPGTDSWDTLQSLVGLGLVRPPVKSSDLFGGLHFFHVTAAGIEAAQKSKGA